MFENNYSNYMYNPYNAPNLDHCDFYAVLNMIYSDYYSTKFDTANYIELAKDFIEDKDAEKGKVLKYYMFLVD